MKILAKHSEVIYRTTHKTDNKKLIPLKKLIFNYRSTKIASSNDIFVVIW